MSNLCALIEAWLKASQRSQDCIEIKRSVGASGVTFLKGRYHAIEEHNNFTITFYLTYYRHAIISQ